MPEHQDKPNGQQDDAQEFSAVVPAKPRKPRGPDKRPRKRRTDVPATAYGQENGNQPNAGRVPSNVGLPAGAVGAVKSIRWRVPEDIPEDAAEVADEAFGTVVDVMRHGDRQGSLARLAAAKLVREEVCGPVPKEVRHQGDLTWTVNTGIGRAPDDPVEDQESDDDAA